MGLLYLTETTIISFLMTSCRTWSEDCPWFPIGYTYEAARRSSASFEASATVTAWTRPWFSCGLSLADDQGYAGIAGDHAHYFRKDFDCWTDSSGQALASSNQQNHQQQSMTLSVIHAMPAMRKDCLYLPNLWRSKEAVRISNGFFVFCNPDQKPWSIACHPYAVRRACPHSFSNEMQNWTSWTRLYTTALRWVFRLTVCGEDGQFVILTWRPQSLYPRSSQGRWNLEKSASNSNLNMSRVIMMRLLF